MRVLVLMHWRASRRGRGHRWRDLMLMLGVMMNRRLASVGTCRGWPNVMLLLWTANTKSTSIKWRISWVNSTRAIARARRTKEWSRKIALSHWYWNMMSLSLQSLKKIVKAYFGGDKHIRSIGVTGWRWHRNWLHVHQMIGHLNKTTQLRVWKIWQQEAKKDKLITSKEKECGNYVLSGQWNQLIVGISW